MTSDALVLSGGGVAGIAWEIGLLFGIQEEAPDTVADILADTTMFVGTSAGSVVAALVAGGARLRELFDAQVSAESAELAADVDLPSSARCLRKRLPAAHPARNTVDGSVPSL